jgi:hypothetical protein
MVKSTSTTSSAVTEASPEVLSGEFEPVIPGVLVLPPEV